jgi:hypothetical protein
MIMYGNIGRCIPPISIGTDIFRYHIDRRFDNHIPMGWGDWGLGF